jgi:hypothetical protein
MGRYGHAHPTEGELKQTTTAFPVGKDCPMMAKSETNKRSAGASLVKAGEDRTAAIALLAYQKWQARGCPDGDDLRDWLEAESELLGATPRSHPAATLSLVRNGAQS